ncbi:MAG: hypothetical protein AAF411_09295, partial [Myxococcota bacterium]
MKRVSSLACLFFLAVAACSGGGSDRSLQVNVRTDFAPLIDFSEVTVEVAGQIRRFEVGADQNFIRGVRVAEFEDLAVANASVRAALLTAAGTRVLERLVEARVTGPTTVTVTLTRSCLNVECPNGDNASATECDNGRCVVPGCSPERPELCEDSVCLDASEC